MLWYCAFFLITNFADINLQFCRKACLQKLILYSFNKPLTPTKFHCLGDPGTKNLCNQGQVSGFPETRSRKSLGRKHTKIIYRGHLKEFRETPRPLYRLRGKPLRVILFLAQNFLFFRMVNETGYFVSSIKSLDFFYLRQIIYDAFCTQ